MKEKLTQLINTINALQLPDTTYLDEVVYTQIEKARDNLEKYLAELILELKQVDAITLEDENKFTDFAEKLFVFISSIQDNGVLINVNCLDQTINALRNIGGNFSIMENYGRLDAALSPLEQMVIQSEEYMQSLYQDRVVKSKSIEAPEASRVSQISSDKLNSFNDNDFVFVDPGSIDDDYFESSQRLAARIHTTNFSPPPTIIRSKEYVGEFNGQEIPFARKRVRGDGNCALYALGFEPQEIHYIRQDMARKLKIENELNPAIRQRFHVIIETLLSLEGFTNPEFAQLKENFDDFDLAYDTYNRTLMEKYGAYEEVNGEGDAHENRIERDERFLDLLENKILACQEYLNSGSVDDFSEDIQAIVLSLSPEDIPAYKRELQAEIDALKGLCEMRNGAEQDKKAFCTRPDIFTRYADLLGDARQALWVDVESMKFYAEKCGIRLFIWQEDPTKSNSAFKQAVKNTYASSVPEIEARRTLHVLYAGEAGQTDHFDILEDARTLTLKAEATRLVENSVAAGVVNFPFTSRPLARRPRNVSLSRNADGTFMLHQPESLMADDRYPQNVTSREKSRSMLTSSLMATQWEQRNPHDNAQRPNVTGCAINRFPGNTQI